jgi:hypothetical protein
VRIRSLSIVPFLLAWLAFTPAHADPTDGSSCSSTSSISVEVSVDASSWWQQILQLFGIIGGGEPGDEEEPQVASFGIIGGGTPPPNGG